MHSANPDRLTIARPDDWHLHLRDGATMRAVLPWSAGVFRRAIVMPNLAPPVTGVAQCAAYRRRILAAAPNGFEPLMTLYLAGETTPQTIAEAADCGFIHGVKLYPRGATTHSADGVADINTTFPALEAMQRCDMPLLVHGEVTDDDVDAFDREKVFIERTLIPLRKHFPELRIVLEHITTKDAADYVAAAGARTAATITPHHLLYSRNALFDGGLRPHHYCLPLPQREAHREALIQAACSGAPCFFLGTDSAPHAKRDKESGCGCAGVFNAPAAIGIYATVFDAAGRLGQLEPFASRNGPHFYKLPVNTGRIELVRRPQAIPEHVGDDEIVPLLGGASVAWSVQGDDGEQ